MARVLSFGASSNVLCADVAGDAANLEFSPSGLQVVRGDGGAVCHTNHFLSAASEGERDAPAPSPSSIPRLTRARALAENRGQIGVAELKRILRDESEGLLSICRHPDPSLPAEARVESVASVIMELAAAACTSRRTYLRCVDYETIVLSEAVPV